MADRSIAHQADVDQRHAAARAAATDLVTAAGQKVIAARLDIRSADVVLEFAKDAGAATIMNAAPCGEHDCVLAAALFLAAELAIRTASDQARTDSNRYPSTADRTL